MLTKVVPVCCAWLVVWAAGQSASAQSDARLLGHWEIISEQYSMEVTKEDLADVPTWLGGNVVVTEGTMIVRAKGSRQKVEYRCEYTVDRNKTPAEIDMRIFKGDELVSHAWGIYEFRDGQLRIAMSGEQRPKTFSPDLDPARPHVMELRRRRGEGAEGK